MPGSVDECVRLGLTRIDRSHQPADRVSRTLLRAHPHLDNPARARVSRGLHGVRCHHRALSWLLTQAGLPHEPRLYWAAYRVHVLAEDPDEVAHQLGLPGLAPGLRAMRTPTWPKDPVLRLATQRSLPTWIAKSWSQRYGETEAHGLAEALNQAGPLTLRCDPLRLGRPALAQRLADEGVPTRPGRWSKHALHCEGRLDIRAHPLWLSGDFEVQDEGSQLIAQAVQAQPGERVLDLCAGSGGKTLALAASMRDRGQLFASDVEADRLADLRHRVRRRNLNCVQALQLGAQALPKDLDRVLVDAPCSGTGTWRRGPDRRWHVLEAETCRLAALQLELLLQAASHLKPAGRLVYATCSLLPQENEQVVEAFMRARPDFVPVPCLPEVFGSQTQVVLRPDLHGTDGFFIAAFGA